MVPEPEDAEEDAPADYKPPKIREIFKHKYEARAELVALQAQLMTLDMADNRSAALQLSKATPTRPLPPLQLPPHAQPPHLPLARSSIPSMGSTEVRESELLL